MSQEVKVADAARAALDVAGQQIRSASAKIASGDTRGAQGRLATVLRALGTALEELNVLGGLAPSAQGYVTLPQPAPALLTAPQGVGPAAFPERAAPIPTAPAGPTLAWCPVDGMHALPSTRDAVLVIVEARGQTTIAIGAYQSKSSSSWGCWGWSFTTAEHALQTHGRVRYWMPLPAAPESEA